MLPSFCGRRCTCFMAWKRTWEGITTIACRVVWFTQLFKFTGSVGFKVSPVELQVDCWLIRQQKLPRKPETLRRHCSPFSAAYTFSPGGFTTPLPPVLSVFGAPGVLAETRLFTEVFMSPSFTQPQTIPSSPITPTTISVLNPQLRSFMLLVFISHSPLDIPT